MLYVVDKTKNKKKSQGQSASDCLVGLGNTLGVEGNNIALAVGHGGDLSVDAGVLTGVDSAWKCQC